MKKFISWVSAIAVFVSVINCREAEELTTIPDEIQNQSMSAKVKKDSTGINPTSNESNSLEEQESDPPPKNDEIKW
ncbi:MULTISPECIES: hypothetical protein [Chryseobacterium]|uniref:hypothetical protein n=1 Tax=Chryseobacterium TaxID=59732 RepID=UPI000F648C20|nr:MULTISPECIES: hypothetical protein [Chryseobacterium]RRQ46314.1 hypothetical protein DTW91_05180 [Chryseobacterium sp. SC28]